MTKPIDTVVPVMLIHVNDRLVRVPSDKRHRWCCTTCWPRADGCARRPYTPGWRDCMLKSKGSITVDCQNTQLPSKLHCRRSTRTFPPHLAHHQVPRSTMSGSSIVASQIYLAQESGELVLKQGVNPNVGVHADTRVLIIGGGVTGLTVSSPPVGIKARSLTPSSPERMDAARCWLLCHHRLRSLGIAGEPNHVPDRWCTVSTDESNLGRFPNSKPHFSWEWPPAVCGRHTDLVSLRLSKGWCMTSYKVFDQLRKILPAAGPSGHGVRMRVANFFFDKPVEQNEEEYEKMCEIEEAGVRVLFCTP